MQILFGALLFLVAFLYAMVGHGGASGYLALMALFGVASATMRSQALVLNIVVSLIAFWQYAGKGNMNWRLFLWLVAASVPAAFIGGNMVLDDAIYKKVLGVFLLIPVIRFAGFNVKEKEQLREATPFGLLITGAVIGLISGMIGIGGGVILTPVLLIWGVARFKETAAVSALFITVNSAAGLMGNANAGIVSDNEMLILTTIAILGGTLGSYAGAKHMKSEHLKKVLALVLAIAAIKLILQ